MEEKILIYPCAKQQSVWHVQVIQLDLIYRFTVNHFKDRNKIVSILDFPSSVYRMQIKMKQWYDWISSEVNHHSAIRRMISTGHVCSSKVSKFRFSFIFYQNIEKKVFAWFLKRMYNPSVHMKYNISSTS